MKKKTNRQEQADADTRCSSLAKQTNQRSRAEYHRAPHSLRFISGSAVFPVPSIPPSVSFHVVTHYSADISPPVPPSFRLSVPYRCWPSPLCLSLDGAEGQREGTLQMDGPEEKLNITENEKKNERRGEGRGSGIRNGNHPKAEN